MWLEAVAGGILLGQFLYHRLFDDDDAAKKRPEREIKIPRTDEGGPFPLLYGRCRVRSPVLAYVSQPEAGLVSGPGPGGIYDSMPETSVYGYSMDMLFVLGIPFLQGNQQINRVYVGDRELILMRLGFGVSTGQVSNLTELTGNGAFEETTNSAWLGTPVFKSTALGNISREDETNLWIEGGIEFLNGNDNQELVDTASLIAQTAAAESMLVDGWDAEEIPNLRGYLSVFLTGAFGGSVFSTGDKWHVGLSTSIGTYSFEASSYPFSSLATDSSPLLPDCNPVDVLYDILVGLFGKLHIPLQYIDTVSFTTAANTIVTELNGYSRSSEDQVEARELIKEILAQIDGILYEDPKDSKVKIKLIRGDYSLGSIRAVDQSNCKSLTNFAQNSWSGLINKVTIVYNNRQGGYIEGTATKHNSANAVGQDGQVREAIIRYPGCCVGTQAVTLAGRELNARSRPIAKCKLIVDRSFKDIVEGDVVNVTWAPYGIDRMVFRVVNVDRGERSDNHIILDVIQDLYGPIAGTGGYTSGGGLGGFPIFTH